MASCVKSDPPLVVDNDNREVVVVVVVFEDNEDATPFGATTADVDLANRLPPRDASARTIREGIDMVVFFFRVNQIQKGWITTTKQNGTRR